MQTRRKRLWASVSTVGTTRASSSAWTSPSAVSFRSSTSAIHHRREFNQNPSSLSRIPFFLASTYPTRPATTSRSLTTQAKGQKITAAQPPAKQIAHGPPKVIPRGDLITLSEEEQKIFQFLIEVCNTYSPKTSLRVAGGWVRDKLLQRKATTPNDRIIDVDIALDNMVGSAFCEYITKHLQKTENTLKAFGVIKTNPPQSKHLETATMNLFGRAIDFVNLREESYSVNSRIPSMTLGTPVEDAHRRDFTVNALFYNINDDVIEDFTGKGLDDLENGILRTTDTPYDILLEDPLRMLRGIRFAATLGFQLEESLHEAMKNPSLKHALLTKVSRERFGIELRKILKLRKSRICNAFEMIIRYDLQCVIFAPHFLLNAKLYDQDFLSELRVSALQCLQSTYRLMPRDQKQQACSVGLVSSFLMPFFFNREIGGVHVFKNLSRFADDGTFMKLLKQDIYDRLKNSVKFTNEYARHVQTLLVSAIHLLPLVADSEYSTIATTTTTTTTITTTKGEEQTSPTKAKTAVTRNIELIERNKRQFGLWIRSTGTDAESPDEWRVVAQIVETILQQQKLIAVRETNLELGYDPSSVPSGHFQARTFVKAIIDCKLTDAIGMKPLLDGTEVCALLNMQPSPKTGEILSDLLGWQIEMGTGVTKERAAAYLKSKYMSTRLRVNTIA